MYDRKVYFDYINQFNDRQIEILLNMCKEVDRQHFVNVSNNNVSPKEIKEITPCWVCGKPVEHKKECTNGNNNPSNDKVACDYCIKAIRVNQ